MKALTISEPWASLIYAKEKHIETRSWETKYRGELFIHAGKTVNESLKELEVAMRKEIHFPKENRQGNIIAKCELTDCVKIDEDFIKEIKKNKREFISGIYKDGRFAWILDNIEPLKKNVPCSGHLRVWNIPSSVAKKIHV
ncbi:ASCH domain-containing protein [Pediococcus siamensis]|uniref:ASCH domain-containing protein n=1 Tax=Pediococcus siamensis TaxID=381829 RepID=UPI0039A35EB2